MKNVTNKEILEGNIYKTLTLVSFPIMVNQLLQTFYNLVDSYFMGWLGNDALAASAFTSPVFQALISLGAGISIGGMIIFAQNEGAGDIIGNKKAQTQLILVNLISSIFIMIMGTIFSKAILQISGAEGNILKLSDDFMIPLYIGTPSLFIINAYTAIENAKGKTMKPMFLVLMSTILNIIFAAWFLKLGYGIKGIAYGTVLASTILAIYSLWVLYKDGDIEWQYAGYNHELAKKILRLGIPVAISSAIVNGGFVLMNKYIIGYGSEVLSAYGIGNRVNNIFYTPANAISSGISIMVGQNLGAKKFHRIKEIVNKGVILSCGIAFVSIFVLIYNMRLLTSFFTEDEEIMRHSINFLKVFGAGVFAWAIFQALMGYFQGLGFTRMNFIMNVGRIWFLRVPFIILIEKNYKAGAYSVWWSMLISNVLTMMIVWIVYLKNKEKNLTKFL